MFPSDLVFNFASQTDHPSTPLHGALFYNQFFFCYLLLLLLLILSFISFFSLAKWRPGFTVPAPLPKSTLLPHSFSFCLFSIQCLLHSSSPFIYRFFISYIQLNLSSTLFTEKKIFSPHTPFLFISVFVSVFIFLCLCFKLTVPSCLMVKHTRIKIKKEREREVEREMGGRGRQGKRRRKENKKKNGNETEATMESAVDTSQWRQVVYNIIIIQTYCFGWRHTISQSRAKKIFINSNFCS